MQIKIQSEAEAAEFRSNRKRHAFVFGNAKGWKPGAAIEFVKEQGAPGKQKQAAVLGTATAATVDSIAITHDHIHLQKVGALTVNGFKFSRSEANRFAIHNGFSGEREMYLYFNYKWTGKLIKWEEAVFK